VCGNQPGDFGLVTTATKLPRCPQHDLAFVDPADLAASADDPLLGHTVAGRFVVLARLGTGSMGSVYRARQEAVGRDVALKIVRPDRAYDREAKRRFELEARATSALVSPNTVTVFDFGEAETGAWFLAMELLEGETLGQRLKRDGRLEWREAVRFAREALESLAEAHAKGIVHRDLKPDNLFIVSMPTESRSRGREVCKVLDFGIAKLVRGDAAKLDQFETQAGTVFGTPRYMSPEQAQGGTLDARSDLYSLGVMLYHAIAGRAPFIDDDAVIVMARHIQDRPPRFFEIAPSIDVPAAIEQVTRKALAKSPDKRPQSAQEFAELLDRAIVESETATSGVRAAAWSRRVARLRVASRTRWVAFAGSGLVAAIALGAWLAGQPSVEELHVAPLSHVKERVLLAQAASDPVTVALGSDGLPAPSASPLGAAADAGAAAAPSATSTRPRSARGLARPAKAAAPGLAPSATAARRGERYGRFE
jgi:serine/threonine-protein kinase